MIFFLLYAVPYWGSLYFNRKANADNQKKRMFPSPIGGLYISIKYGELDKPIIMFPSPIGGLYISING